MTQRSWLFAPGDSAKKLEKLPLTGADAVVLDLEDAVAPQSKQAARDQVNNWLIAQRANPTENQQRWVRINGIDTPWWKDDLVAAMAGAPAGLFIPKVARVEQLQLLNAEIYELEGVNGIPHGSVKFIPQLAESPGAALGIRDLVTASLPRLAGFNWGAEDLAAAIGATRKRDAEGMWTDVFRFVRAQVLLAAHAREVQAIDALHVDFRDLDGLRKVARASAADGFTGMLAIHPAQVPIINAAFAPSAEQVAEAKAIVAAFAANPSAGALSIEGKLVEQPHLDQARRILDRAG